MPSGANAGAEAAPAASLHAQLAPGAAAPVSAEACAPRATRLAAAGARAAAIESLPKLFALPWPALRRILCALPPEQRVAIGAVCKPLLAASKHPEGARCSRYAQRAQSARKRRFPPLLPKIPFAHFGTNAAAATQRGRTWTWAPCPAARCATRRWWPLSRARACR